MDTVASCKRKPPKFLPRPGIWFIGTLFVLLMLANPRFLTIGNLVMLMDHGVILGILALGLTFVVIVGCTDIAFANMSGFVGVIAAILHLKWGCGTFWTVGITLLLGILIYFFAGLLVAYRDYPALVVSIALSNVMLGLNYAVSNARPVTGDMAESFVWIANGRVLGVPFSVIFLGICYAITYFVWRYTVLGYHMYAIGGNETAARICGVGVRRMRLIAYVLCGIVTAIAGIIATSRLRSGQPVIGPPFLLETLGAVFFGKIADSKREATVQGTLQGVILLSLIFNGVTLLGYPYSVHQVLLGGVLIMALFVDHFDQIRQLIRQKRRVEAVAAGGHSVN